MSKISIQLQDLLLEEGKSLNKAYMMSKEDFKAYNDAAHVFIEKCGMSVSLYDLIKEYIKQFGGDVLYNALCDVITSGMEINADLIFISMVLFTDSTFGLFFTGKFNYEDVTFSLQEIANMLSMWVERAWSFWHFESIIDQRLFFAAMLVRIEIAANRREMWREVNGNLREFFSNPREPQDQFEKLFIDWCSAATRHVEMALEFSALGNNEQKVRSHVPIAPAILAFAMSRRVPQYLKDCNAWILSYFQDVDFHYAARLNVVYKPESERSYKTMDEIRYDIAHAVDNYRESAGKLVKKLEDGLDENGQRLPRKVRTSQKYHNNLRQKKKDLKILNGLCGCDEEGNEIPNENYKGRTGEDARKLRESELKATVASNSYIYTRILDSFPFMNHISNVGQTTSNDYQVTVQLYSYRQYAKEVDRIYAEHGEEIRATVEREMNLRKRLRAVFLAQESGKVYKDLQEDEKEELLKNAENEMMLNGEWDRTKETVTKIHLDEEIAKIKDPDARVNYTFDVDKELIENPTDDFRNTPLQIAAIIPAVDGLYINERVRRGVLRIFHGKQRTYAQYKAERDAIQKALDKYEHDVNEILKKAGKR